MVTFYTVRVVRKCLLVLMAFLLIRCAGDSSSSASVKEPSLIGAIEIQQLPDSIQLRKTGTVSQKGLLPDQARIDTGITYTIYGVPGGSPCTAVQTGGLWRTCCDLTITNNTGADLDGLILIGWEAKSGSPEAGRSGGNNTGYDGSGTGWRTTDGITPDPGANGGWALWMRGTTSLIPDGATSFKRRICLQSPTGYSVSVWYLYAGCPSGKILNANNNMGLMGEAMLGDVVNDPNYPELGSGNYTLTDPDGFYAFPEITATDFVHNASANCFNSLRMTTTLPFIEMPLTPACLETFIPNDDAVDSILVFDHTQDGNTPPLRNITGGNTSLSNPHRVAVDTVNNEIVVANNDAGKIAVYNRLADGNVSPLRIITGNSTGLNKPEDVAVDTEHDEIVVMDKGANAIYVFSRTANGNVAPLRTISGAATKFNNPRGIALDYINDEIFVTDDGINSVLVFSRTADGNVAPIREIVGALTGLDKPRRPAVDPINDEVIVPDKDAQAVFVFSRTANGNVAPIRTISGALTGINKPEGVAVDTLNNEIIVASKGNQSLRVFSRTANGDVSPLRTISGGNTLITKPFGPGVSY